MFIRFSKASLQLEVQHFLYIISAQTSESQQAFHKKQKYMGEAKIYPHSDSLAHEADGDQNIHLSVNFSLHIKVQVVWALGKVKKPIHPSL